MRQYGHLRVIRDLAVETEDSGWGGFFVWDHQYRHEMDDVADADAQHPLSARPPTIAVTG